MDIILKHVYYVYRAQKIGGRVFNTDSIGFILHI